MPDGWIEYPYAQWKLRGEPELLFRPFIPITVKANGEEIPISGLVDSGCNTSMIDIELMDDLKIERKNCQYHPVGGIGGEGGDGWITNVIVLVDEFNVEYESQVIFTKLHSQIMLLGQKDFFREFRVDFEGNKGVFRIRKVPKLEI